MHLTILPDFAQPSDMRNDARNGGDIDRLAGRVFDVVVIGGGIQGTSAAREAAAAGYSVLLVEKDDFASGASSRSSRLLHCGLRYFEAPAPFRYFLQHPGRFMAAYRMARQAMLARREIVLTTSQRVVPLTFAFPVYRDGPYTPFQVDIAFKMLSRMAPSDVPLNYRQLKGEAARSNPMVAALGRQQDLVSAAQFTEYQFNWPERLCVDAVLDARQLGAEVLNYTEASIGPLHDDMRIVSLHGLNGAAVEVKARRVLTMAGVWIDKVLRKAKPDMPRKIFGTKGAHIVIRLPEKYRRHGVSTINSVGEPFYCIPWHDLHYIGPTETPFDGDPDRVHTDADDLEFILDETASLFPGLNVTKADVVSTWAGVRPLTYNEDFPKGDRARTLHDLSSDGMPGVLAMTAGPIMSHRLSGREVIQRLKGEITPSGTPGALTYAPHLPLENTNTKPLADTDTDYHLADVRQAVQHEQARSLFDVLYRRTGLGWRHKFDDEELSAVADLMAEELSWPKERRDMEIEKFRNETERLFGVPGQQHT